jgi:hypothetical protein
MVPATLVIHQTEDALRHSPRFTPGLSGWRHLDFVAEAYFISRNRVCLRSLKSAGSPIAPDPVE